MVGGFNPPVKNKTNTPASNFVSSSQFKGWNWNIVETPVNIGL